MSFLKKALKPLKNEYASMVEDGLTTDNTGFIDTGSYIVNAQFSGSIYGGFPSNKMTIIAGPSGVGKSFFALSTVKSFQDKYPTGEVAYFDSEAAFTKEMFENRGMDVSRIAMIPVSSVDDFKFQSLNLLDQYEAIPKDERPPLMLVLDSLGNLATVKEITDATEGKSVADMTRGKSIRSVFRVVTLKMGKLNVPLVCTNHTYACLTAGHNVQTSVGLKDISEIRVGDIVKTSAGFQEVLDTVSYEDAPTVTIHLDNGETVTCTPNHKFYDKNCGHWVYAEDIVDGMDLAVDGDTVVHQY